MSKEVVFKAVFWSFFVIVALASAMMVYLSYQQSVNPKQVFGTWVEIGAPSYQTEVLRFSEQGVHRNERLVSTNFTFNGTNITINTGNGTFVYQLTGTFNAPQLKRVEPSYPTQRFIRKELQHTINNAQESNAALLKRSAVSKTLPIE